MDTAGPLSSWWCYFAAASSYFTGGSPFIADYWYSPAFLYVFYPFYALGAFWGLLAWATVVGVLSVVACAMLWKAVGWKTFAWCLVWMIYYALALNVDAIWVIAVMLAWRKRKNLGFVGGLAIGAVSFNPILLLAWSLLYFAIPPVPGQRAVAALGTIAGAIATWSLAVPFLPSFLGGAVAVVSLATVPTLLVVLLPVHYPWWCAAAVLLYREKKRTLL
jgi:hypothetical protein